jgi:hypothetical protein
MDCLALSHIAIHESQGPSMMRATGGLMYFTVKPSCGSALESSCASDGGSVPLSDGGSASLSDGGSATPTAGGSGEVALGNEALVALGNEALGIGEYMYRGSGIDSVTFGIVSLADGT